ncbi:c-type cytochrome [Rhodalgimonas zhirmunskyi]|uniref:Cytochrome c n=1 Tax=Rhodalgimonas zhirmunskyi TaxID=2964767 RepID=A0AAJ1U4I0_9RHOB|nr:cytochrome c [Rhodoalgimonas zhirmunskyi]MDQ2092834.1 cytochrome c [Rhodoalgimonas zhirmunskyi]
MKKAFTAIAGLALATAVAGTAIGQSGDEAAMKAVKARQDTMMLFAFNLGTLGGMAKGAIPYDADTASAAAKNLSLLSQLNMTAYWVEGTSTEQLGDKTEALPAIWSDMAGFEDKHMALTKAAADMEAAAGQGLDQLKGAVGAVGGSCGGCHKQFRVDN